MGSMKHVEGYPEGGVLYGVLVYHQISCIKNQDYFLFLFLYLGYGCPYRYVCTVRGINTVVPVEDAVENFDPGNTEILEF